MKLSNTVITKFQRVSWTQSPDTSRVCFLTICAGIFCLFQLSCVAYFCSQVRYMVSCRLTKRWIKRADWDSARINGAPLQIRFYLLIFSQNTIHELSGGKKKPVQDEVRSQIFTMQTSLEPVRIVATSATLFGPLGSESASLCMLM